MAEDNRAYAPYNFIPFSEQVIYRYASGEVNHIPGHDEMGGNLKNGEIHVTVTTCTPLFVGNGNEDFVRDENGHFCIPGSSLRGLIRGNVFILGLAPLRSDDYYNGRLYEDSHSIENGLPNYDSSVLENGVDYVRAMFGFIDKKNSWRSRVSFEDLRIKCNVHANGFEKAVFRTPSPSGCKTYLENGKSYYSEEFRLRGFKQYWMKQDGHIPDRSAEEGKSLYPVLPGSCFEGVIRYHNLMEDELGLLLWALRLEDGCYMSLGGAKPYGYGRIKLKIDSLMEFNPANHYSINGLCNGLQPASDEKVNSYISIYHQAAVKLWNNQNQPHIKSLKDLSTIQDFFYMRKTIVKDGSADYMSEAEYIDAGKPMYTVREMRDGLPEREANERSQQAAQQEPQEERSMEELLAALKTKFNSSSSVQVDRSKKKR